MTRTITIKITLTGEAEEASKDVHDSRIMNQFMNGYDRQNPYIEVTLVPGWQPVDSVKDKL